MHLVAILTDMTRSYYLISIIVCQCNALHPPLVHFIERLLRFCLGNPLRLSSVV